MRIMAGRKSKVDLNVQMDLFRQYKTDLVRERRLVGLQKDGRSVYEELGEKLKMTSKAVFLSVKKNIAQIVGVDELISDESMNSTSTTTLSCVNNVVCIDIPPDNKYFVVNYEVGARHRLRKCLPQGWTYELSRLIWLKTKSICCFSFKTHSIVQQELFSSGVCRCGGVVQVNSILKLTKLEVVMKPGDPTYNHVARRRITGLKRREMAKVVSERGSAFNTRIQIIDELMDYGDQCPSLVPTLEVLRVIRHEGKIANYRHQDIFESLIMLKNELPDVIQMIGYDPFFIIYWHPTQVCLYNDYAKRGRVVICIDATGSVVQKPSQQNHVFLYTICVSPEQTGNYARSFNVAHFLSSAQSVFFINIFLRMFCNYFRIPNEVRLDESPALILSCIMSFTRFKTVNEYLRCCFAVLDGSATVGPEVYLRLDVAHYVKNLCNSTKWATVDKRVKSLFVRVMGFLVSLDSFDELKIIIKFILTLILSPFETKQTEEARLYLLDVVRFHEMPESEETIKIEEEDQDDDNELHDWLSYIEAQINTSPHNEKDNMFFAPHLKGYFYHQFKRVPLWSSVMNSHFGSPTKCASSAPVENSFKEVKKFLLQGEKRFRADMFLEMHIKTDIAMMKAGKANFEENKSIPPAIPLTPSLIIQENWKNKAPKKYIHHETVPDLSPMEQSPPLSVIRKRSETPTSRRKRTSILRPLMDFKLDSKKSVSLPILRNNPTYTKNGIHYRVRNACAFDSIAQAFVCMVVDIQRFEDIFAKISSKFFQLILKLGKGSEKGTNEMRVDLLRECFAKYTVAVSEHVIVTDCYCNINDPFQFCLPRSMIVNYICDGDTPTCKKTAVPLFYLPIDLSGINNDSLSRLSDIVDYNKKACKSCGKLMRITHVDVPYGFLYVDCQPLDASSLSVNLNEIQDEIIVEDPFHLKAVLSYSPGHYTAYVKRPTGKWELYDDTKKYVSAKIGNVNPVILIYCKY